MMALFSKRGTESAGIPWNTPSGFGCDSRRGELVAIDHHAGGQFDVGEENRHAAVRGELTFEDHLEVAQRAVLDAQPLAGREAPRRRLEDAARSDARLKELDDLR